MSDYYKNILKDHINLFENFLVFEDQVNDIANSIYKSFINNGKLILCGNGGSAADSQHIAAEFVGRFEIERGPLPAIALTTDTSVITCLSNDYNYNDVFSRQIKTLGKKDDCLLAISTSGNSKNVLNAVKVANKLSIRTIGILGNDGGDIKKFCKYNLIVNSKSTARIQEAHIFLLHAVCGIIDRKINNLRSNN